MAAEGKKLVKGKGGYRMVPANETFASPFTLPEPVWVPDAQCPRCIQCQGKFDFINRKHHCRRCGKCFCDQCCAAKVALQRMLFVDPVRHCAGCTNISKRENDFFEKHVKNLLAGGLFHVNQTGESNDNDAIFTCKLSPDHRLLCFENEHKRLDDILMTDIESLQICTEENDSEGNPLASGLAMRYKDSCGETQMVKMIVCGGQSKRQAQTWVASMQKAFKMIHESRSLQR